MKPIKVVSLFDGMACGMQALKQAGIPVKEYHAFEIDKHAIQVAMNNHPKIIQHGDVNDFNFRKFKDVDLLLGGSPCQGFSSAGYQKGFDDPRSRLFWRFVDAKIQIKPKHFLLENVRMKKDYLDVITRAMGVDPILLDSASVSAQTRKRYYWTSWLNLGGLPELGVKLQDIIEKGVVDRDKSYCIDAHYYKGGNASMYFDKHRRQQVICASLRGQYMRNGILLGRSKRHEDAKIVQCLELAGTKNKTNCLTSVKKDNVIIQNHQLRNLTVLECERLQTLPEGYTEGPSNTQRYKMIGNGWTVRVIQYLLENCYGNWTK